MKRAIVIYATQFGNTRKIANALAHGMEEQGILVDCVDVNEVDVNNLTRYDLLAIGGPTHMLGLSDQMKKFLEKLKTVDIKGKQGFCFDTRVESRFNTFDLNSAAKRIERRMKRMKVEMIKPRRSAIVEGREGPLQEGAERMYRQIGVEIAEFMQGR